MARKIKQVRQITAAICMCIGAMALGTSIGWTSNIIHRLQDGELNEIDLDYEELQVVASTMTLGAVFVCCFVGWLVNVIGRKPTVILTSIPFVIGWVLIIFIPEIIAVYIGRFLIGIAGGSFSVTAPLYTSEIAHVSIRGTLGTFYHLFVTIGILYCGILGWAMPLTAFNAACLAVPIVFLLLFTCQPETPVYDLKEGHIDRAIRTFKRFRGNEYDFTDEIDIILEDIEFEKEKISFFRRMNRKATKKAAVICFMLMFYQQLSGVTAFQFYTQEILKHSSLTLEDSYAVMLLELIQVVATAFSSLTVDRFGRKFLLILSATLMFLSTTCIGAFFSLKERQNVGLPHLKSYGYMPILSINVFVIAYSIGFGPIPWLAPTEMFANDVKIKCCSAVAGFRWLLAFIITRYCFNLANWMGTDITFYVFSFFSATAVLFVVYVIPETKDKTFAEIQAMLEED